MIPKYIFNKQQLKLNKNEINIKENLEEYRMKLYTDLQSKLIALDARKIVLINNYKIAIREIDEELK